MEKDKLSVRSKAARWIFGGTAILIALILATQIAIIVPHLIHQTNESLAYSYLAAMAFCLITTLVAYKYIPQSLDKAAYLYIGGLTLALLPMIFQDRLRNPGADRFSNGIFGLDIGVFILGILLGWKPAAVFAGITSAITLAISVQFYGDPMLSVPIIFFAILMILPSWLVDRLEQNFKQSEEKFSTVVRESLDVILVLDPDDYRILTVNPTITPVLGYTENAVIGQSVTAFLPPASKVALDDLTAQSAPEEDLITSLDVIKRDGSTCPADITATMIPWEEDKRAILVTLRDITERRRQEEELRQYREHLEELVAARTAELAATNQRLEAYTQELEASNAELDAFAHTVAHDLKGPIGIINGFSALLVERTPRWPHEKIQKTAQRIKRTGDRMTSIIDELLLLASVRKQKDLEIGPLSMDRIMAEVRDRLDEMIAEYHAEIVTPKTWPTAAGYGPWIEEVWANYLSNALKYGGEPPHVELGAEIWEDSEHPMVRFWIRDNGPGLTREEQAQLFTQFTRLHLNQARGHGLGLSIVQRIVERLNGDVGVESEPGQGSTFYFTLPLIEKWDGHHIPQTG